MLSANVLPPKCKVIKKDLPEGAIFCPGYDGWI